MKNYLFVSITIIAIATIALLIAKSYIKSIIEHLTKAQTGIIHYYTRQNPEESRKEVAEGLALDFGLAVETRTWLAETCPYPLEECKKCKYWTCPGKENKND